MNDELIDADNKLDELYSQLKKSANNSEIGWHEFSQCVQEFTRLLFRYKRMNDNGKQRDEMTS